MKNDTVDKIFNHFKKIQSIEFKFIRIQKNLYASTDIKIDLTIFTHKKFGDA